MRALCDHLFVCFADCAHAPASVRLIMEDLRQWFKVYKVRFPIAATDALALVTCGCFCRSGHASNTV
ncbi:hypothetical protein EON66_04885 [archaeon]|nr:MAG: hypothetical protein EON66_04885 [archaeon]